MAGGDDDTIQADSGQLHGTAGRVRARAADLITDGPPEEGDSEWPSHQAISRFHAGVHGANHGFHGRMSEFADGLGAAANRYTQTDHANGQQVGAVPKDAVTMATAATKDIATAVTGATTPFISAVAGATGALGSAMASSAGALGNAAAQIGGQVVTTQAKLNPPAPAGGAALTGGANSGGGAAEVHPAAAQIPPAAQHESEGATHAGAAGDRATIEAQRQQEGAVIPAGSSMPMSGMGTAAGGRSPARGRTYSIAITKHTGEDEDACANT